MLFHCHSVNCGNFRVQTTVLLKITNKNKINYLPFFRSPLSVNSPLVLGMDTKMANSTGEILGVTLVATMSMDKHIKNIVRLINIMQLRKINTIRRYISNSAVKPLFQSAVISSLDYRNIMIIR